MQERLRQAPPWQTERWFNTREPLSLEALRGKVIMLEAFQMLCPGCVSHALPQAMRVKAAFPPERVAVIGLHTVFEHHEAMMPAALEAFLHEYRIDFPVGVDRADGASPIPLTMRAYNLQGTPSTILIDAQGALRFQRFGQVSDLALGANIATLLAEPLVEDDAPSGGCTPEGCAIADTKIDA